MRILALGTAACVLGLAAAAYATVIQSDGLRVTALSQISPYRLPREGTAPISVFVAGHIAAVDGGIPAQLQRMRIEVNRRGLLRSTGLPACPIPRIQTASSRKAIALCTPALIGSGRFWAHIVLADQPPYPTRGRLLIFNGRRGKQPLLLAHIYTPNPFPSSFVVAFAIRRIGKGTYGTELSATLPQALGDWGYVDRIKLNLKREYRYRGRRLSYFNAGCPAPRGADRAPFQLARAHFHFEGRAPVTLVIPKSCGVRR